jgi:lysozyme
MALTRRAAAGGGAIVLASASLVAFVGNWEGREHQVYKDIVGVPTVCDGITGADVIPGKVYTDAECDALTAKHVTRHGSELLACIKVDIPQGMYESLASWAYNVGTGAACSSTLVKLTNQGQFMPACDQLLRWDRAGGKKVRGLTNRREAEHKVCVKAVQDYQRTLIERNKLIAEHKGRA